MPFSWRAQGVKWAIVFGLPALAWPAGSALALQAETKTEAITGFSPRSRIDELKAEAQALGVPTPERARAWLRSLTEEPHVAGTAADYKTAVEVRDKLKSWGWDARIAEYEVLLNYPVEDSVKLELVRPISQKLAVREDPHGADKDSASPAAFPAFHGYGVSGDVSGQVVYANYGRPEDFDQLEKLGVSVKGKIVLARYGELFRGLKVRNAQKRGAIGILIYSDPADDGYGKGDVYPNGPYRPASAIQRGSVQFLSLGPGDPSTPRSASVKGAQRLPTDLLHGFPLPTSGDVAAWEAATGLVREDYFATIPSLPISYASARPILEALGGPNAPSGWQGGLPLAYHTGPGPAEARFAIQMSYKLTPIWNVIATLKGTVEADRSILIGNHRDAWVYGAVDPSSGTAATLEMARALGAAVKAGWKPRRSITYASWDGEEYGLVGSTEWADEHSKEIDEKVALLLNVDSAVSGPDLDIDGVPSLRELVLEAADAITDIRTGKTLKEGWVAKKKASWASSGPLDLDGSAWTGGTPPASATTAGPPPLQLNALGSGSDYTAFLDHLGVPSLDVGFSGRYGVYHSIYDNFYWMEKFGDPEFVSHAMAAKLYTLIVMRAAGSEVLPFKFVPYGAALRDYIDDLRRLAARRARGADAREGGSPIAFEGLDNLIAATRKFQDDALALDKATLALANQENASPVVLAQANDALQRVERAFLLSAGLPGRPWFRHSVYAPGLTTGYACWPLPGVRQAIQENDAEMLRAQVPLLVERIQAAGAAMRRAEGLCRQAIPQGAAAGSGR